MKRRHALLSIAAAAIALATPAFAGGQEALPGFREAVAAGGPVLVHVTAPWCGECRRQRPIVAELLATRDFRNMTVFNVDFDSQKAALRELRIQQQSTLVVYKGGREVNRLTGSTDPAVIERLMREAL